MSVIIKFPVVKVGIQWTEADLEEHLRRAEMCASVTLDGDDFKRLLNGFADALARIAQARAEERERLLFVLNNDAFLTHKTADHGAKTYQLWMQDADEDYHVLHDKNEFFATPLEAVDAAIRARKD